MSVKGFRGKVAVCQGVKVPSPDISVFSTRYALLFLGDRIHLSLDRIFDSNGRSYLSDITLSQFMKAVCMKYEYTNVPYIPGMGTAV